MVTSEVTVDNKPVGKPIVVMSVGTTAFVETDDLSLKINLQRDDALGDRGRTIGYEIYLPQGKGWHLSAHPTLQTMVGQNIAIGLRSDSGQAIRLKVSVEENAQGSTAAPH